MHAIGAKINGAHKDLSTVFTSQKVLLVFFGCIITPVECGGGGGGGHVSHVSMNEGKDILNLSKKILIS